MHHLVTAIGHTLSVYFIWIPSHVGVTTNVLLKLPIGLLYLLLTPRRPPFSSTASGGSANHPAQERLVASEYKLPVLRPLRLSSLEVPTAGQMTCGGCLVRPQTRVADGRVRGRALVLIVQVLRRTHC